MSDKDEQDRRAGQEQDANLMIGAGVGVGALGAGAALLTGAVCPLCYIVPPALIAAGAVQKVVARRRGAAGAQEIDRQTAGTDEGTR